MLYLLFFPIFLKFTTTSNEITSFSLLKFLNYSFEGFILMGEALSRDIISYEQDLNQLRSTDSTYKGQTDLVSKLLRRGKRPNKPDDNGDTALHKVCACGQDQVLETLLKKYGSVLDLQNQDGLTPFLLSVLYGRIECARKILTINQAMANSKFLKNPVDLEYSMKNRSGRFLFSINNYSKIEERKICSDSFNIGGCQWRLVVYPRGSKSEDYVSIYLEIVGTESYPERWSYLANFKFSILNPSTGEVLNTRVVHAHKFSRSHPDLGFPQFIRRSALLSRKAGFLPKDRLLILFQNEIIESNGYRFNEMNGTYTWSLGSAFGTKERVVSDEFSIGGFNWVLIAYPKGKSSGNFLSLYLKIIGTELLPEDWFIIANFSVSIIDQHTGYKFTRAVTAKHFWKEVEDWGISQFALLPSLYDHEFGFINYGSLKIELKLDIIDSHLLQKRVGNDLIISQEFTPLHWAAYMGHIEGVTELIGNVTSIDSKDKNGRTPLDWASYRGEYKIVELLLAHGASVDSKDSEGYTALHKSIISRNKSIANLLLSKGADVNAVPRKRKSSLIRSMKLSRDNGSQDLSEGSIERKSSGSNLDLKSMESKLNGCNDISFHSPLQMAVLLNQFVLAEMLISNFNADANIVDLNGMTPLHYASYKGDFVLINLLIEGKADVDIADFQGYTPLHKAVWNEDKVCVDMLLKHGANPTIQSLNGTTALHLAVQLNNLSIVKTILKYTIWRGEGKDTIEEDNDFDDSHLKKYWKLKSTEEKPSKGRKSDPGLRSADIMIFLSKPEMCNTYPAKEVDSMKLKQNISKKKKRRMSYLGLDILDIKDSNGNTPLLTAVKQGNIPIALNLIQKGSDLNFKNQSNKKPIDIALENEDIPMITLLLENGAKILKCASSILHLAEKRLLTVPLLKEDIEIPKSTMSVDMGFIVNNPEYSDIEFIVEGESVFAWKGILCARSEFFRAMFLSSLKESSVDKIRITDVPHIVFLKILHYIYTDDLDVSSIDVEEAIQLLSISDRYILKRLKKIVEISLLRKIEEGNVVKLFLSADLYEAPSLRLACIYFMVSNAQRITNVEDIANYASFSTSLAEILKKAHL